MRLRMALSQTEISVKSGTGLRSVRCRQRTLSLAYDIDDLGLQDDILHREVRYLGEATARVDKESQNRHVAPALEVCAFADLKQVLWSLSVTIGTGTSGMLGGFIRAIGESVNSPSSTR
jgi:hypothetical protein